MAKQRIIVLICFFGLLLAQTIYVNAQQVAEDNAQAPDTRPLPGKNEPEWGTTTSMYAVNAFACVPYYDTMQYSILPDRYNRYCTSATCVFGCHIHLPSGAKIIGYEVDGCDSNSAGRIYSELRQIPYTGLNSTVLATIDSGTSNTPGCSWWGNYSLNSTVHNQDNTYLAIVSLYGATSTVSFNSIRVYYQLQVSPAPSSATFNDVPTSHIFFQYVEALVDAGITGGCAANLYCPDNYVTRGQMAKFLAVALGLNYQY